MERILIYGVALGALFLAGCAGNSSGPSLPLVTPTIYYRPVIDTSTDSCPSAQKQAVLDRQGRQVAHICEKSFNNCRLQGSCVVVDNGQRTSIRFEGGADGNARWSTNDEGTCPDGVGADDICLDPYYSVAADLNYHHLGEVIFVPRLIGAVLPDGTTHSGYLIVRDRGGAIQGQNRFDFYTGLQSPSDPDNSFARLGLGDTSTHFGYQVIDTNAAEQFRQTRNYPAVPGVAITRK